MPSPITLFVDSNHHPLHFGNMEKAEAINELKQHYDKDIDTGLIYYDEEKNRVFLQCYFAERKKLSRYAFRLHVDGTVFSLSAINHEFQDRYKINNLFWYKAHSVNTDFFIELAKYFANKKQNLAFMINETNTNTLINNPNSDNLEILKKISHLNIRFPNSKVASSFKKSLQKKKKRSSTKAYPEDIPNAKKVKVC